MTTFLLIANLILDICILANLLGIKNDMRGKNNNKDIKGSFTKLFENIQKTIIGDDDFYDIFDDEDDDDFYETDETPVFSNKAATKLKNRYDNEDDKYKNVKHSDMFKDVHEFIDYLSKFNLKIIDTVYGKARTVRYLDNYTHNGRETVLITFDDDTKAVFKPYLYARMIYD